MLPKIRDNSDVVYSEKLLDHFANPRNVAALTAPTLTIHVENPICGDELRLSVECDEEKIIGSSFRARGCTASIACGSALTELVIGRSRGELARILASDIEMAVDGLIPESKHAAVLCADAVRKLESEWKSM